MNKDLYRTDLPTSAHKVLCVVPCSISMAISATPTIAAIRQAFPNAHITCIVETELVCLLDTGIVNRFLPHIQEKNARFSWSQIATYTKIKMEIFDLFIDFFTPHPSIDGDIDQSLFIKQLIRTHLFYRAIANAKTSIGFTVDSSHYQHFFCSWLSQKFRLSINIPTPKNDQLIKLCLSDLMLKLLIDEKKVPIAAPLFPKKIQAMDTRLLGDQWNPHTQSSRMILCVFFGGQHQSTQWPFENTVDFIKKAAEQFNANIHLVGKTNDVDQLRQLENEIEDALSTRQVINYINCTDMSTLAAVIQESTIMITTFGGPLHIADAYNIPLITIGSSSVNIAQYAGRESRQIMLSIPVPCSPCLQSKCDQAVSCMEQISAGQVLEAVNAMMSDRFSRVQN